MSDPIEFLAAGLLALKTMTPEMRARWRSDFRRVVAQRGGVVDGGECYVKSVARAVLSEVITCATRRFANELTPRAREHLSEDDVERLEGELSNILRKTLDRIASGP